MSLSSSATSPRLPKLPASAERASDRPLRSQRTSNGRPHELRRGETGLQQQRHPLTLAVVQQLRAQLDMRYPLSTAGAATTRSVASGAAAGGTENVRVSSGQGSASNMPALVGVFRGAVERQRNGARTAAATTSAQQQQSTTEASVCINRDCDAVLPGETGTGALDMSSAGTATFGSIPLCASTVFPLAKDTEMLHDRIEGRNLTAAVFRGLLQPFAHSNARGESDGVAQTLDHMIEQLLRQDPYYAAIFPKRTNPGHDEERVKSPSAGLSSSSAVALNEGQRANEGFALTSPKRGSSRSPRRLNTAAGDQILPLPARVDGHFRCIENLDSVSLVQAHLQRAQPLTVDFERFLSSQQRLANILSLGWGEVIRQIRGQSTERAAVLSTIRSAFEAVLNNAHDAAWYYKCVYDDVAQLRVDETIKDLSNQLAAKVDECKCLTEKVHRLEAVVEAGESLKKELQRLQAKQELTDKFLKDQLVRNAAIMKMATQATGGVIPPHVIAAMMGVASGGGGGGAGAGGPYPPGRVGPRRSTRQRFSMASGGFGSLNNMPSGEAPDIEVQRSASVFESNPQSPQKAFSPPPFFVQQQQQQQVAGGFGGADAVGFSVGEDTASVDGGESVDAPFSSYDLVDANTQTTIDDAINAQLMNEFQSFYVELDRAANYSQSVCRIVYGSTDFYNPTECCENARKLLEEISLRAIQERELHHHAASAAGGASTAAVPGESASGARPQVGGGGNNALTPGGRHSSGPTAASSSSSSSLIGFFDVSKERTLKLLAYGIAAAKEMRMRFGALAENDSFRRAVEWKAPRGPKDPCRCCGRTTLSSEELAVMQEVTELRDKIKSLEADVSACHAEIEKLGKRVEFERQISQTRAEELDAVHRIRRSMLPEYTQTEAAATESFGAQTDLAVPVNARMNLAAVMHASSSATSPNGLPFPMPPSISGLPSGESSATVTPFYGSAGGGGGVAPTVTMGTPHNSMLELDGSLLHNADAEWSRFGASGGAGGGVGGGAGGGGAVAAGDRLGVGYGMDATFVTRSAAVGGSARRRSSIEVTFHDDGRSSGEPVWGDSPSVQGSVAARQLSADRRTSRQFLSTPRSGSGSETSVTPTRRDVSPNAAPIDPLTVPPPHHHNNPSNPASEYTTARRGSELTANALRYRDTFLSLGRAARSPPQDRSLGERREASLLSTAPSSGSGLHRTGSALTRSASDLSGSGSVRSLNWTIRMMGSVYRSRFAAGQSERAVSPDTAFSCSKHFADFLRQNFGTKALVEENANAFLRAVHVYRKSDARFALFARLFEDEFHKGVYRAFLTFSALLDQTLSQYDAHASAKKGDELAEPSFVPLEHVLNAIYTLFFHNDKYAMREELCHLLALRCVELSTLPKNTTPTTTTSAAAAAPIRRKASLVAVKAFDVPGTPIESSDAFSKYRDAFRVQIPSDAASRVVLRIAVLTFFCEVARPYVVKVSNLSPVSTNSRSNSALPETVL